MPGGNFDDKLKIRDGKICPAGPLSGVARISTMTPEVYTWVAQQKDDGTGAFMAVKGKRLAKDITRWTTEGENPMNEGQFKPGPALGIAVLISKNEAGKLQDVYVWHDAICLEPE